VPWLLDYSVKCKRTIANLTFRGPCIVIYSYNKSQRYALLLNFILVKNSTRFGQIYCSSSDVLILYSQQLVLVILVRWTFCWRGQDPFWEIVHIVAFYYKSTIASSLTMFVFQLYSRDFLHDLNKTLKNEKIMSITFLRPRPVRSSERSWSDDTFWQGTRDHGSLVFG